LGWSGYCNLQVWFELWLGLILELIYIWCDWGDNWGWVFVFFLVIFFRGGLEMKFMVVDFGWSVTWWRENRLSWVFWGCCYGGEWVDDDGGFFMDHGFNEDVIWVVVVFVRRGLWMILRKMMVVFYGSWVQWRCDLGGCCFCETRLMDDIEEDDGWQSMTVAVDGSFYSNPLFIVLITLKKNKI